MNIEPLNTIGILGGMSSVATSEYYNLINQNDIREIPLFDTTDLHCEMAAKICTGEIKLDKKSIFPTF